MKIKIRQEKTDDFKAIFEINSLAFEREDEARLVELLRGSQAFIPGLSIVAEINHKIVGHILFSKITIVDDNKNGYESLALAPMAVRPEFQQKGIGGQLIKHGLDKASALNHKSIIVLGHEHYYPKFGFKRAENWQIKAPFGVPASAFMALELIPNGLKGVSGIVQYPEEFGVV